MSRFGGAPLIWTPRLTLVQFREGLAREQAEQRADESYDRMMAPPCPGCGEPVVDEAWERHKYERHALNDAVQPYGRPDAREALFLGGSVDKIEERLARWGRLHPGCTVKLLGEGTELRGKVALIWRRYRVINGQGREAR